MAWLSGYGYRKPLVLTGGASGAQTDFQIDLAVAHVAAKMQTDFDDLRFTRADGTTLIDAWLESYVADTSAKPWAEFPTTPANTVEQTYYMYYGNVGAASDWDGAATFLQYQGSASSGFVDSLVVPYQNVVYEAKIKTTSNLHNINYGLGTNLADEPTHGAFFKSYTYASLSRTYTIARDPAGDTFEWTEPALLNGNDYALKFILTSTDLKHYVDGIQRGATITTSLPYSNMGLYFHIEANTATQYWSFARKYAANPPTYAFGAEESAPPPADAIMNQFQRANIGADLYNGALAI